jgi:hypothetical protein
MFWRRHEMNAKSFQVIIRVRESGNLRLASVARTGIELTNIQRSLQKAVNLPASNFRAPSFVGNLRAAVDIPTPLGLLFCDTAPTEVFRCDDGSFARIQAFPTTYAAPVGQLETGATVVLRNAQCSRGTDFDESVSDRQRQAVRDNVGHSAALTVSKQSFYGDQLLRLEQALPNHVTDHRSLPE